MEKYIRADMRAALKENKIDMGKDWHKLKTEEAIEILRKVEGSLHTKLEVDPIDPTYVVTIDNLLKMLSIQLR